MKGTRHDPLFANDRCLWLTECRWVQGAGAKWCGRVNAIAPLLDMATWIPILDGDDDGRAQYERHYSARKSMPLRIKRGTRLYVGPGFKLVLAAPCRRALFVWRKERYRADGQEGINYAIFRNEGAGLSSQLIIAADNIADARWGSERHFTFVDGDETADRRSKRGVPGQCFIHAGWRQCGVTAKGLHILEREPT